MDLIQIIEMCAKVWVGGQILGFVFSAIVTIIAIVIIVKMLLTRH